MFLETNPISLKTALNAIGITKPLVRLPLTPMDNEDSEIITKALNDLGWLKR